MNGDPAEETPHTDHDRSLATNADAAPSQSSGLAPNDFFCTGSFKEGVEFQAIRDAAAAVKLEILEGWERQKGLLAEQAEEWVRRVQEEARRTEARWQHNCTDVSRNWAAASIQRGRDQDSLLLAQKVRAGEYVPRSAVEGERSAREAFEKKVQSAMTTFGPRSDELASRAEAIRQRERQRKGTKPTLP